ncbi:MAG: peptidase C13 family-domain-containing protein [Monoraphidium minutum]|nr:MAG: peptidase C13 family-domain-containing protein [Monoraphidium minutum]
MIRMLVALLACVLLLPAGHAAKPMERQSLRPSEEPWWQRLARSVGALADAGAGARGDPARAAPVARSRRPRDYRDGDDPTVKAHWAVLVAGSNGWGNYRHQADVYHAYQVLRKGGLLPQRMVVLAYDDIAGHTMNPLPGRVYNRPGGPDVYEGVAIDYRGPNVTADTFLAVLRGDARAVAGRGTGRVLESGPHDKVFLFYSDHGAAGVLGMPEGPFLYADQLHEALRYRAKRDGFKEMVLYIEACESGSIFEGLLDGRLPIYATTAANAVESSWATYCPTFGGDHGADDAASNGAPNGGPAGEGWALPAREGAGLGRARAAPPPPPVPPPPALTTCLGDLYSVAWLEDAEGGDLTAETLEEQFHFLRLRTSNNFSYVQGSHVMRYGDLGIDEERAGDYMGMHNNGSAPAPAPSAASAIPPAVAAAAPPGASLLLSLLGLARGRAAEGAAGAAAPQPGAPASSHRASRPQRGADLIPLAAAAAAAPCPKRRAAAAAELGREVARRAAADAAARGAAALLLADDASRPALLALRGGDPPPPAAQPVGAPAAAAAPAPTAARRRLAALLGAGWEAAVEDLLSPAGGRPAGGAPVVDDWGCLRGMVAAWQGACGPMDQYAMRHTRLMANLCNAAVAPAAFEGSLRRSGACSGAGRLVV